jgi:dienelactone hydrolase
MARAAPAVLAACLSWPGPASAGEPAAWVPIRAAGRVLASAWTSAVTTGEVLTVVIEGDGDAFDSRGRPAADPTPRDPLGYRIAGAWPKGPVVWLGRLCQFTRAQDPACASADWSHARFSDTAVRVTGAAIDQAKARAGARKVVLVGWSGGGVLAMLAAQRRTDVAGLATFAAPLDVAAWTRWHGLTPLQGSLDPAAGAFAGPRPRQVHLFGAFDPVAPPTAFLGAARTLAGPGGLVAVRPERHDCCWTRRVEEAAESLSKDESLPNQAQP